MSLTDADVEKQAIMSLVDVSERFVFEVAAINTNVTECTGPSQVW